MENMNFLELTNLESLKVIAFWKIVENGCIEILDQNYKSSKKYTEKQLLILSEHWKEVYDQFYEIRENKSGKYVMAKNFELVELSAKLEILADIENRLILLINLFQMKELSKFVATRLNEAMSDFKNIYPKVKLPIFYDPYEALTIVQAVIKAQTNIFDEKVGVKQKAIVKQKETIYDVVSIMSKQLGYGLDINNMTCLEFIGHENTVNATIKAATTNKSK